MKQPVPGPKYTLPPLVGLDRHDPRKEKAPGFSFGSRYKFREEEKPGPYAIPWGMNNKGKPTCNGFSLVGRPRDNFLEKKRAEQSSSTYEPNMAATEPSSPRYSFGLPRKTTSRTLGPGPIYSVPSTIGGGRAARIYGRNPRQSFHYDNSKSPGPIYNPPQTTSNGVTIGSRTYLPGNKFQTPGPIYNPSFEGMVKSSPRYTMGVRHHPEVITLADVSD